MKKFKKILITSIATLGILSLNINTVEASNIKQKNNNNITTLATGPSLPTLPGGGGSYGLYVTETRVGAPWIIPKSIYVTRTVNGKTYKGTLYVTSSKPLGSIGVIPNHMVIAYYSGYIY